MDQNQHGQKNLYTRLMQTIDTCTAEWDLTYIEILGCLSRMQHNINSEIDKFIEESTED